MKNAVDMTKDYLDDPFGSTLRTSVLCHIGLMLMFMTSGMLVSCTSTDFGGVSGKKSTDSDSDSDSQVKTDIANQEDDDDDDDGNSIVDEGEAGTIDDPTYNVDREGVAHQSFKVKSEGIVDIAFFVDTSGSMHEEIAQLELNINSFLKQFVDEAKIDFQLFLVAGPDKDDGLTVNFNASVTSNDNVEAVIYAVDSHDGLKAAQALLSGSVVTRSIKLRADAIKELVFVTDDEAKNPDKNAFATFLAARSDEVHVNGIVGVNNRDGADCSIAGRGTSYIDLAAMNEHNGLIQDLCAQDWGKLLKELKKSIDGRVTLEFALKSKPSEVDSIKVTVAGKKVSRSRYVYDAARNRIKFNPEGAPKAGDHVVVTFKVGN